MGNGPAIAKGVKVRNKKNNKKHEVLVIDEEGTVGIAPYTAKADDLLSGNYEFTNLATGEKSTGHKAYSAVNGWDAFWLNGKENWHTNSKGETTKWSNQRPHNILCVKSNGDLILLNTPRENTFIDKGWNAKTMLKIVKKHECNSAYDFDGGGSVELAFRYSTNADFIYNGNISTSKRYGKAARNITVNLVFTSDNNPPYIKK